MRQSAAWPHRAGTRSALPRASASGSRGCARRAARAVSACEVTRTSASNPSSRAGTPTAATAGTRWWTSGTPTGSRRRSPTAKPPPQAAADPPPEPLDAAILFAPVGTLVLPAMAALDRGGRLAIAGIHLSDIPTLNYESYLFEERELVSVTANSRRDGEEFLALAAEIPIRPDRK